MLAQYQPEKVFAQYELEDILAQYKPEEILAQFPAIQETLAGTEKEVLLRGQRNTLLRQLQRRFGALPEPITQTIETTLDLDQLDHWLDQILDAQSLDDMAFPST